MKNATTAMALLSAAAFVAGCGGGGGGDAAPIPVAAPAPPRSPSAPLALVTGNAVGVTQRMLRTTETLLALAQFVGESVQGLAAPGASSPQTFNCATFFGIPSTVSVTLTDSDGNGIASPGDHVSIRVNDCYLPWVNDTVRGSIDIDLASPSGLAAGGVRGVVSMGSGVALGIDPSAPTSTLLGSAQLEWSTDEVTRTVRLSASAADDLRVTVRSAGSKVTEAIRQPELTKSVLFGEARTSVSIACAYESELSGGRTLVSTPVPLLAYLNSTAEMGRIEFAGAGGSKVVVSAIATSPNREFQFALDANGDGAAEESSIRDWVDAVPLGFLWWDGLGAARLRAPSIGSRPVQSTDFYATTELRWATSSSSVVRLQFSRPIAASTPSLFFRLADRGAQAFDASPLVDIGLSVEHHGALFVLRPVTPLRHGRLYDLQRSTDGITWDTPITVQDTFGNSLSSSSWGGSFAATPATLRARPKTADGALFAASDATHLDGRASTSTDRPIVAYRWLQVAGTPLRINSPNSAQTDVSWDAVGPTGIESAVFELTVTDAAGDSDAVRLPIVSADLSGSTQSLYYRNPEGGQLAGARTAVVTQAQGLFINGRPSAGVLQMQFFGNGLTDSSSLTVSTANGAPLQIGAYEGAVRALFTPTQNGLDFSTAGRGCNQLFGRFDVLDVQVDGAGKYSALAVDFEQHCEQSTAPPLLGSYRLNSTIPLRR
jgi:hypothetical protein